MATFVNVESYCPDRDAYHRLGMIEKLDGFSVQWEVVRVLKENTDT